MRCHLSNPEPAQRPYPKPRGKMLILGAGLCSGFPFRGRAGCGRDAGAAHTGAVRGLPMSFNRPCLLWVIVYLRTTAAVQFISTKESPGRFATATVVRAGPPLGKYVLKTPFIPS
jgi:hypothetical protein